MGVGAPFDGSRVPVVLSVHDLSLFSRHPHVPHAHADSHESPVDHRQRFEHAFHHALGTGIVRAAAFTIYPSHFMHHRIEALPHHPAHVVAPGIEPPARARRSARRHDQIALLGGGQEHKGGPRLARIAAALAARGHAGHQLRRVRPRAPAPDARHRRRSRARLLSRRLASRTARTSGRVGRADPLRRPRKLFARPVRSVGRRRARHRSGVSGPSSSASARPTRADCWSPVTLPTKKSSPPSIARGRMPWAALPDRLPAPPTAAQAAERHLALYRDAGFMADPAGP